MLGSYDGSVRVNIYQIYEISSQLSYYVSGDLTFDIESKSKSKTILFIVSTL